jgi:hypothetical protein
LIVKSLTLPSPLAEEEVMKGFEEKTKGDKSEDAMVGLDEFARLLGNVPTAIIKRYLREGKIRGTKIAGNWFIPLEEAERFLKPGDP